jgi:hypothetical protein
MPQLDISHYMSSTLSLLLVWLIVIVFWSYSIVSTSYINKSISIKKIIVLSNSITIT